MTILTKNLMLDILQIASEMRENGIFFLSEGVINPLALTGQEGCAPLRPPAEKLVL